MFCVLEEPILVIDNQMFLSRHGTERAGCEAAGGVHTEWEAIVPAVPAPLPTGGPGSPCPPAGISAVEKLVEECFLADGAVTLQV